MHVHVLTWLKVPMQVLSEAKIKYGTKDLRDWCDYAHVDLQWPDVFPLRTVLPLRVTLASKCDPVLIMHLCTCILNVCCTLCF